MSAGSVAVEALVLTAVAVTLVLLGVAIERAFFHH